jgi:hypothetical protein
MTTKFKWTVEIEINPIWVADGYEATPMRIKDAILNYDLGYAMESEVRVKAIKSPPKKDIRKAQGYK